MKVPVIAIVGRPNVGKSTLFNQLTDSRQALVLDEPGVTRDRQYGEGRFEDHIFIVIDTGGLSFHETPTEELMQAQSWQAVEEADIVFFVVDAKDGPTGRDIEIAKNLRKRTPKHVQVVVNKTDGLEPIGAAFEFHVLGLGDPMPIAAKTGRGVRKLMEASLPFLVTEKEENSAENDLKEEKLQEGLKESKTGIRIVMVGRPNVGKSTLVNRLLGEDRVVVWDEPGTTRDSIYIPYERRGESYLLIDTAGVRKKAKITNTLEKFSVVKTLQAIQSCDIAVLVLDARVGILDQDLQLIDFILEAGKGLVLAVNKWDNLSEEIKEEFKQQLQWKIKFLDFVRIHFISALHGTGVGNLYGSIQEAHQSARKKLMTPEVTRLLQEAVIQNPPPLEKGRRIKLRYAHVGGHQPPRIVIHGNQTDHLQDSYKRYLIRYFQKALGLMGTPLQLLFKNSQNPYQNKRSSLTPRQKRTKLRAGHRRKTSPSKPSKKKK